MVLVVVLAGLYLLFGGISGGDTATYNQSQLDVSGQNVLIPLTGLADNSFHFYSIDIGGTTVKYFAVKDSSDNVHTAFNACDVCYRAKKGYHQSGDYAQCNNCGRTFSIADIGTKNTAGGCWPGYLASQVQDNNVVIKKSDLEAGKYYFS